MSKKYPEVVAGVLLGLGMWGSAQAAEGWRFLPVMQPGFQAKPTIAGTYGVLDPDVDGAGSGSAMGVELSFDCILLQTPGNRLRQQLSYTRYDEDGVEIRSLELNPHYVFDLGGGLQLGFGPGLGYVQADADTGEDADMLALQAGGSVHYRRGMLFLGLDARYQVTQAEDVGAGDDGADNFRALAKVGVNF